MDDLCEGLIYFTDAPDDRYTAGRGDRLSLDAAQGKLICNQPGKGVRLELPSAGSHTTSR